MIDYKKPLVMGILNVTNDSFSDGGNYLDFDNAIKHVESMVENGVDIIDIGGESSRPGATPIDAEMEWSRIGNIIQHIKKNFKILLSVDTYKPIIAHKSLDLGADIINDIYGFSNPELRKVVSDYKATAVIMHMKGNPSNMQEKPIYKNVFDEVFNFLNERVNKCEEDGISDIILDPGIGFGKTHENNLDLLKNMVKFSPLNKPILLGASRKSFIVKAMGEENIDERDFYTNLTTFKGLLDGISIFRVHNVVEARKTIDFYLNIYT